MTTLPKKVLEMTNAVLYQNAFDLTRFNHKLWFGVLSESAPELKTDRQRKEYEHHLKTSIHLESLGKKLSQCIQHMYVLLDSGENLADYEVDND